MNLLIKYILFLTFSASFFFGCNTSPSDNTAKLITIQSIKLDPGYTWFMTGYENYTPGNTTIQSIISKFKPTEYKFLILSTPQCACKGGWETPFPEFMKVLTNCNIPDSCYQVYSMEDINSKLPLMNKPKISSFPSIFTIKNGNITYSLVDTLKNIKKDHPDSIVFIEQLLLQSLQ
jgi:hypothetical protein